MNKRPLIAALSCFTGGIIAAHYSLHLLEDFIFHAAAFLVILLLLALFFRSRVRMYLILIAFLLSGTVSYLNQYHPSQLMPLAISCKKVTLDATVLEPPRITYKSARMDVMVERLHNSPENFPIKEKVSLTVYKNMPPVNPGDMICFSGRLKPFKNFNNPGRYDYESAMKMKGLSCSASVSDGSSIILPGRSSLGFPRDLIETLQRPIRDFLITSLSVQDSAVYRALILGERQGISRDQREMFNRTGLGHLLAVSGLHIGLIAWISFFVIKWLLLRSSRLALKTDIRKTAAFLTCIPVLAYSLTAGFHVSTQRALVMILAFLASMILGREKDAWSTLAMAGLIILLFDPFALFSISFQLSFTAVVGILWLTPVFLNLIFSRFESLNNGKTFFGRIIVYFIGLFAVTLSATVFLLPLITFYFHRVSCVTVPANILIMPVLGLWVLPLGLISAALIPVYAPAADVCLQTGTWGLHVMMKIIESFADLSWSSFWTVTPNLFEISVFYALIFFMFFYRKWIWARRTVFLLVIVIIADIAFWTWKVRFNNCLEITFLDVGQGNAALVAFPGGKKMLIDGGGFSYSSFDIGSMVVAPFLWHSKIMTIDYLVLSHPHSDHMNGLVFIAESFRPGEYWSNGDRVATPSFHELMNVIESKGIKKMLPEDLANGMLIGGACIEVLHPLDRKGGNRHLKKARDIDNRSLVLKLTYQGKSILFPGDISQMAEKGLVSSSGDSLRSHVLLCPHHGSKGSSSMEFLESVKPDICIISSGEYNRFGFPHDQVLRRLQVAGSRVARIDRHGAVRFTICGNRADVMTFH
ncbi:MAG: DNA internalization-related competence protein ComEC/Rec2 [Deltaproteobacteria bacterium]|nr:DNA internalization-related competence protein ComEC/Rec2 [Deltaproteobacteria bacterium]